MAFLHMFSTSNMAKRLLRYALSQVDLLDTDALNIDDNLNLAFSRQTTLEFRDVGLRVKKLASLLNLPPAFTIQRAKVRVLKVTLPIDIYSTPISIEVDNVEVDVLVADGTRSRPETPRASTGAHEDPIVPDPANLAQSFLQTQSRAERRELEQALANEHDAEVDDDTDDDSQIGTGQPLSLPAFMTGFLQGIVDRVQIKINRVEFQLGVEIAAQLDASISELVSVQLALDSIDVQGVTVPGAAAQGEKSEFVPKEGKRHVGLHNLRAYLISEAGQFAHVEPIGSREASPMAQSTIFQPAPEADDNYRQPSPKTPPGDRSLRDSEAALGIPYDLGAEPLDDDAPETPRVSQQQTDYPFPRVSPPRSVGEDDDRDDYRDDETTGDSDDLDVSRYEDASPLPFVATEEFASPVSEKPSPLSPESVADFVEANSEMPLFPESPTRNKDPFEPADDGQEEPAEEYKEEEERAGPAESQYLGPSEDANPTALEEAATPAPVDGTTSTEDSTSAEEDLTQSRVFTHEEAESMYMSAFSNSRPSRRSRYLSMPGAWGMDSDAFSSSAASDVSEDTPWIASQPDPLSGEPEPSADRDEPPVPNAPPRLIREILSMRHVSIYVPSQHKQVSVTADGDGLGSLGDHVSGSFSMHLEASTRDLPRSPPRVSETEMGSQDKSLEVILSPLEVRFDTSLALLLVGVVSRLVEAATKGAPPPSSSSAARQQPQSQSGAPAASSNPPNISISASSISLMFLDRLAGVVRTSTRELEPDAFLSDRQTTLLQASLNGLGISRQQTATRSQTVVKLKTFQFGYADAPILGFNREIKMTGSYAELPPEFDVSVQMKQLADGSTNIFGHTLPISLMLDLQRIDETLGWFGGLSDVLDASVATASGLPAPAAAPAAAPAMSPPTATARPRRVSFNVPDEGQREVSTSTNIRIGGAELKVIGRGCEMLLRTSTVKLALTNSMVGAHISSVELTGPHLHAVKTASPIKVRLQDARARFFAKPRDQDMDRLLSIVVPSDKAFDGDDELMVDPLLRQRRQGSLLTVEVKKLDVSVAKIQQLACLSALGEELAQLGAVAKYFPDDDRPGMLLLAGIKETGISVDLRDLPPSDTMRRVGAIKVDLHNIEVAHVGLPLLAAASIGELAVMRNGSDRLVDTARIPGDVANESNDSPVFMVRMIGDEMEPVVKVRLQDLEFEYRVPVMMELLGLGENATREEYETHLVASVASLGEQAHAVLNHQSGAVVGASDQPTRKDEGLKSKPITLDLQLHNCLLGLNPLKEPSKLVVVIENAQVWASVPDDADVKVDINIRRSWLLLINDTKASTQAQPQSQTRVKRAMELSKHMGVFCASGFVNICEITNAKVLTRILEADDGERQVDVRVSDIFVLLETCADSTYTLMQLAASLAPPTPPSNERRYRTQIVPLQNVLASITEDAFGTAEGDYEFDNDFTMAHQFDADRGLEDSQEADSPFMFNSQYYRTERDEVEDRLFDAGSVMVDADGNDAVLISSEKTSQSNTSESELDFANSYYDLSEDGDRPRIWNSTTSRYSTAPSELLNRSPLRLAVRDVKFIWNMHDGYDWAHTRDVVATAIHKAAAAAQERRERRETKEHDPTADDELVGDCLFNSVYIHIPTGTEGNDLAAEINFAVSNNLSETASTVPSTAITATTRRTTVGGRRPSIPQKKPKLGRSRNHKVKVELMGISADVTMLPPGSGETQVTAKLKVDTAEIFDNMPTSTWKKFLTYDRDAGQREYGKKMVKSEVLVVKPHQDLAASELVLNVEVLPLRLHVDQDALDFVVRFFAFSDDGGKPGGGDGGDAAAGQPFIQRAEIMAIPVKLDFKPKRVDYASLRSGSTTELMNFLILDNSNMELRHAIVYGQPGPVRLGETLKSIWMPDITGNQLPSVLSGLAAVRPIVDVGSGFRELIEIPYGEYAKDGRIMRGISKGAFRFAKRTGTELVRMGAKLAVGTQNALEGAEAMLGPSSASAVRRRPKKEVSADDDDGDDVESEYRAPLSRYAAAPTNVVQGIRMGYQSLRHDLNMARNAAIAIPAEIMESGSASGAVKALLGRSQTVILRPGIAVSKAIGQTLLGATNSIDPENMRRADDKYKHY
jgi:autophagy-related protein 2